MEYLKLSEICSIKTGKLDANASDNNGLYPFFTCSKETLKINSYSYDCECVLVAGNGDLNVKYYNGKFDAYQRTYIIEVNDKNSYLTEYIFILLTNKINELKRQSIGAVIKYIKLENLANIKIPIITIEKQQKIVDSINNMNRLIKFKEDTIIDYNKYIESKFYEIFGNPIINEKKWNTAKLSELGNLKNGMNFHKDDNGYKIKFLGVGEFKYGDIIDKSSILQELTLSEKPKEELLLKEGDIVFVRSNGSKELVGRSVLISNIKYETTYSGFCIRFRNESDLINPNFLIKLFQLNEFKKSLLKDSRGANINNINQQMLSNINVIIPPIEIQNEFSNLVLNIKENIKICVKQIDDLQMLLNKKMNEYFN